MRRLTVLMGCLAVPLFATVLPAFATPGDRALLGSGSVAPQSGEYVPEPLSHRVTTATTPGMTSTFGGEAPAATGLDTGAAALLAVGLMAAGGTAVVAARGYARR